MQKVTLTYTEKCPNTGESGWIVSRRNNNTLDTGPMFASSSASTLTHDILEHWDWRQTNPNLQELVAMGSTLAHRPQDFYNRMGYWGLPSEVATQLSCLEDFEVKLPTSRSDSVREDLIEAWPQIVAELQRDYEITGDAKLRKIAYAHMSRGYNHVLRVDKMSGVYYGFGRLFDKMVDTIDRELKYFDSFDGAQANVHYSFRHCTVAVKPVYWAPYF